MPSIVLVSPRVDQWQAFAQALQAAIQTDIIQVRFGAGAMEAARTARPLAMAIDADVGDMPGVDLIKRLLRINAMINIALVSDQPEEIFHEETEGLGILMKLSPTPDSAEAVRLAECLRQVAGVA
jgi:DNA-binding NarL/FixJ family response regulator